MAKCFDLVGYTEPCNAVRKKLTGRAMIISSSSSSQIVQNSIEFSDNGLKITKIGSGTNFPEFLSTWKQGGGIALLISIDAQTPFAITVQGNTDSGRAMYRKTLHCSLFDDHSGKAEEFIQGMVHNKVSTALAIEREGMDNACDFFGAYDSVRIDNTTIAKSEYENGGAYEFDLVCDEPVPNVICQMLGLSAALDTLNA